jgi:hypothetical protein
VAVECNYDEDILSKAERMPEKVRYRVRHAHMSVAQTCQWLQGLDVAQTREDMERMRRLLARMQEEECEMERRD